MKNNIEHRLKDLEKQQERPQKVRIVWYDDPDYGKLAASGVTRIKLRWLDEARL